MGAQSTLYFLTHAKHAGGAERVLLVAADAATRRGCRVVVGCPAGDVANAARGRYGLPWLELDIPQLHRSIDLRRVPAELGAVPRARRQLRAWIANDPGVVHAFSPIAGLYSAGAAGRSNVPLALHVHDAQPPRALRKRALRHLARRASCLICPSETVVATVRSIGIHSRCEVITPPLDPSFLEGDDGERYDLGEGFKIAMFGHLVPWKGQDTFLAAAIAIADELPDARFFLAGSPPVDAGSEAVEYVASLRRRASDPRLASRVTFLGFVSDPRRLMNAVDVVVHASVEPEAFGLVIAEALTIGKPIVASDVGGPREIERALGGGVVLYPPGDSDALADAVIRVATQPPAEMAEIRARAQSMFAPDRYVDRILEISESLLG